MSREVAERVMELQAQASLLRDILTADEAYIEFSKYGRLIIDGHFSLTDAQRDLVEKIWQDAP